MTRKEDLWVDEIGRYQPIQELGRGPFGIVHLATDAVIGRPVAIKSLKLGVSAQGIRLKDSLVAESGVTGTLRHAGIVTVYDVELDRGFAHVVTEYVDGPSLAQLLAQGRLTEETVVDIAHQIAEALDYAHERGILHRNLKPSNILVASDGKVKITDFGIAAAVEAPGFRSANAAAALPHYMSPEQAQDRPIDARADQFSLAAICYEMFTGEKAFAGSDLSTVVFHLVVWEPPAPEGLLSGLDAAVGRVLKRGMAKSAASRYPTCRDLVSDFRAAYGHAPNVPAKSAGTLAAPAEPAPIVRPAPPLPPPADTTTSARRPLTTAFDRVEAPRPESKSGFPMILLVPIVLIGGVLAWLGVPNSKKDAPIDPPPSVPRDEPRPGPPKTQPPSPPVERPSPFAERNPGPVPARPIPSEPARTLQPAPSRAQVLSITSDPPGANVVMDRDEAGSCVTPCELLALPGIHNIRLAKDGYQTIIREVKVANEPASVNIPLQLELGSLSVVSTPKGVAVSINGKPYGVTDTAPIQLPAGTYSVTLEYGNLRQTESVTIRAGSTRILEANFRTQE